MLREFYSGNLKVRYHSPKVVCGLDPFRLRQRQLRTPENVVMSHQFFFFLNGRTPLSVGQMLAFQGGF
jgi:hypothetical protein